MSTVIGAGAVVAAVLVSFFLSGCAPVGKPMRFTGEAAPPGEQSYVESVSGSKFSCSFVEFDGRGDFVDFEQHTECRDKVSGLAKKGPLLLVTYCHGWKNNSQSGDVVKFNDFLRRLAESVDGRGYRVHGVYLSWRGNPVKPFVSNKTESWRRVEESYGGSIVSKRWQRGYSVPGSIPENLSYWTRKQAAADKISGIQITRAIYTYAGLAKRHGGGDARSFVIGHSFGALMLEQSLAQGMVGGIMTDWSQDTAGNKPLSLPFDLVLFVNSAAPSIYAKQMREFLAADAGRRRAAGVKDSEAPVLISLTSTADGATRNLHRLGNVFSPLTPSLRRTYNKWLVEAGGKDNEHMKIRQSYFYSHTPGHNPLLVGHWLRLSARKTSVPDARAFDANLDFSTSTPESFYVQSGTGQADLWHISEEKPEGYEGSFRGNTPTPWRSPYWFVECDGELIADHGDIWSRKAMDIYAALYRLAASRKGRQ